MEKYIAKHKSKDILPENISINVTYSFTDIYQMYSLIWKPNTWKMSLKFSGLILLMPLLLEGFSTIDFWKTLSTIAGLVLLFLPYKYLIKLSTALTYYPDKLFGERIYILDNNEVYCKRKFFTSKIKWKEFKNGARSENYIALMKPFYSFPFFVHVFLLKSTMFSRSDWSKVNVLVDTKEIVHSASEKLWKKISYWVLGAIAIIFAELDLFLIFSLIVNPNLSDTEPNTLSINVLGISSIFLILYLFTLLLQFTYSFKKVILTTAVAFILQIILFIILAV
jgi:hypothetical protein